jgi:hypothetical protein
LALVLLPRPGTGPRRDVSRDVEGLRQAEGEYRGITATFEDMTRTYILEAYDGGDVVRWEGEPSPRNPDTETLVTAWCRLGKPRAVTDYPLPDSIRALREQAGPLAPVVWRRSTLAAVRIEAGNLLAQDALAVFRFTVDRFVRSMVIADQGVVLRSAAALDGPVVRRVEPKTVLLREEAPAAAPPPPGWSYVRVPSTPDRGWVETDRLASVRNDQ